MGDNNKNINKEILANFSGQQHILTIPKLYIRITGTHEKALVLNQVIFFSNKSELSEDWFYKSYEEWHEEILIPERTLRRIFADLQTKNLIFTRTNKIRGKRSLLIKPNFSEIMNLIETNLSQTAILSGVVDNPPKIDQELAEPDNVAGTEIDLTGQSGRLQPDKMAVSIYTDDLFSDEKNKYICAFDLFWKNYPVKKAEMKCRAIWKRKQLDSTIDLIMESIKKHKAIDRSWLGGYIPNPAKYLTEELWRDEPTPCPQNIKVEEKQRQAQEAIKRAEEQAAYSEKERKRQIEKDINMNEDGRAFRGIKKAIQSGSGYEAFRKDFNFDKNKDV